MNDELRYQLESEQVDSRVVNFFTSIGVIVMVAMTSFAVFLLFSGVK